METRFVNLNRFECKPRHTAQRLDRWDSWWLGKRKKDELNVHKIHLHIKQKSIIYRTREVCSATRRPAMREKRSFAWVISEALVATLTHPSLTGAFGGVGGKDGARALTDIAFAGAHIVHAIFIVLLRVYNPVALLEYFIPQLCANLLRSRFASDVHLARMRYDFIAQEIAGFLCLPFVGERVDSCFNISCGMQKYSLAFIIVCETWSFMWWQGRRECFVSYGVLVSPDKCHPCILKHVKLDATAHS